MIMIKVGNFPMQSFRLSVDSSPRLIIGRGKAPPQWIASLEDWCRNATGKEQSGRLEAAKRVLQTYVAPNNTSLDLSRLDLTELPPGLSHLSKLQELNVSKNLELRKIPEDLGKCVALRSIDASSCSIDTWPACLSKLEIKTLLLDDNPGLRVFPDQIEQCRIENLSMEATMLRDWHEPPRRELPPGEARGRTLVRSTSSSPTRADGAVRARSMSPPPAHATAPSVATMLGTDKARQLDTDFGSLQWPFRRGEPALKDWEVDDAGTPLMLKDKDRIFIPDAHGNFENFPAVDLEKLKSGKKYIWTAGKLGRLIISEEASIENNAKDNTKPQYVGHPTQLGGGRARISGELKFISSSNAPSFGKFLINNASGRYSKFIDRNERQMEKVAELFRKAGLDVEIKYKKRDKLQPVAGLVLQAPDPTQVKR